MRREAHPDREPAGRAGEVEARGDGSAGHDVSLARQLELPGIGLDVEATPLARAKRKTGKIDTVISRCHSCVEISAEANAEEGPT